jgi:hypothetical protein
MSSKLLRVVWGFIVVMVLAVVMYRTVLTRHTSEVQQAAFEKVKSTMQQGLAQMHWQWQYEGRPTQIDFAVGARQMRRIEMNTEGWPVIGRSEEGCRAWLNMFAVDANVEVFGLEAGVELQSQLEMKIEFIESNDGTAHVNKVMADICRYSREGQYFDYALATGLVF